jgi:hypothetical protein
MVCGGQERYRQSTAAGASADLPERPGLVRRFTKRYAVDAGDQDSDKV